jgi:hypothetical protein
MNRVNDYRQPHWVRTGMGTAALAVIGGVLLSVGCPGQSVSVTPSTPAQGGPGSIGVVILVDTSGSMKDPPANHGPRPKYQMANEALEEILRQTAEWANKHPDKPLNLSIANFASKVHPVLGMGRFDEATAQKAVKSIPHPEGGTAIGLALKDGWATLKPVGCERQYILCITDGENTEGAHPSQVVPEIVKDNKASERKLEIHFIAFDVNKNLFGFLKPEDGGYVVEASNQDELKAELKRIFEKRILTEGD